MKGPFYVMLVGGSGGAYFQSSFKNNAVIYNTGKLEGIICPRWLYLTSGSRLCKAAKMFPICIPLSLRMHIQPVLKYAQYNTSQEKWPSMSTLQT